MGDSGLDNAQILKTLTEYFIKEKSLTDLNPDDSLLTSGILDSLAIVKLLAFLEEEFDVEIDDADFDPDNFESLTAITSLVAAGQS